MPQKTVQIKKYTVSRMTDYDQTLRAIVFLYDDSAVIGRLEFKAANVPQKVDMGKGYPTLYFPITAYPDVIDLLRNEEPTYLVWEETMGYGRVVTGQEPAGEGELAV